MREVKLTPAPGDGILPERFYVTSNRRTWILFKGRKIKVKNIRMDGVIAVDPVKGEAYCIEPRKVRKGMLIVVSEEGVIEEGEEFRFMASPISIEKPIESLVDKIITWIFETRRRGERIFLVTGPAVIHSGGREALSQLIKKGYVDVLITGNGFAVHDIEASIFGTSLGMSLKDGTYVHHAHHIWAINLVNKCGSIKEAVKKGVIKNGVMYECVMKNIKYIIVGSIRDDGPLRDTITDMIIAQDVIREEISKGVGLVLCLATALLTIGVANMLPYDTRIVVVDINPAVIAKVYDRGTQQVMGVITDVGLFLKELIRRIIEREQHFSSNKSP